jgi:S1-C subfamily serine protease
MKILTALIAALLLCSCSMVNKHSKYVGSASDALRSTVLVSTKDGSGSGFHIGSGVFITNAHVVLDRHGNVPLDPVYLLDGAPAELIAYDDGKDLAMLSCPLKSNLKPFKLSLAAIKLKDDVLSVGWHFGVIEVASKGFVSGMVDGAIITTAPSNHGCSGGPLTNTSFEVIGVNAFGYSPDYSWSGISGHIDIKTLVGFLNDCRDEYNKELNAR